MPIFPNFSYYYPYNQNLAYYNKRYNKMNNYSSFYSEKNESQKQSCQIENRNLATDYNIKPIFEIFGLKIYMDDILILCLLYFLYEENVKDELLFIALLMLLLS